MFRYFIVHKPWGVLSQFTQEAPGHRTLADLGEFPPDVYPVGRLDKDSEGLLLLTSDRQLNHRLLNPRFHHRRTYLVQVEGIPGEAALRQLAEGIDIRINKQTHRTRPARVEPLDAPPPLPPRDPPVRYRKNVADRWLRLELTEGKNRQVRRMCAAAGYPVLRLIRTAIEDLSLNGFRPGTIIEYDRSTIYKLLKINF